MHTGLKIHKAHLIFGPLSSKQILLAFSKFLQNSDWISDRFSWRNLAELVTFNLFIFFFRLQARTWCGQTRLSLEKVQVSELNLFQSAN